MKILLIALSLFLAGTNSFAFGGKPRHDYATEIGSLKAGAKIEFIKPLALTHPRKVYGNPEFFYVATGTCYNANGEIPIGTTGDEFSRECIELQHCVAHFVSKSPITLPQGTSFTVRSAKSEAGRNSADDSPFGGTNPFSWMYIELELNSDFPSIEKAELSCSGGSFKDTLYTEDEAEYSLRWMGIQIKKAQ